MTTHGHELDPPLSKKVIGDPVIPSRDDHLGAVGREDVPKRHQVLNLRWIVDVDPDPPETDRVAYGPLLDAACHRITPIPNPPCSQLSTNSTDS